MDQLHQSASTIQEYHKTNLKFINDKKGSAVVIYALLIITILLFGNMAYLNYRLLLAKQDVLNDAVTTSALAQLAVNTNTGINGVKMAYGEYVIDTDVDPFINYMNQNINQSIKSWTLNDFEVYQSDQIGQIAPNGEVIKNPSIYVDVSATVTNILGKPVILNVKKLVDADYHLNYSFN